MTKRSSPEFMHGSLEYWADLQSNRRHAPAFARNNAQDKIVVERATVFESARSLGAVGGSQLDSIVAGPDNAYPDFTARLDGKAIAIELTELLHSPGILRRAAKGRLNFEGLQWTEGRFRERVSERINSKGDKLSKRGRSADVLILHTDEPWLSPQMIEHWLDREAFSRRDEIEEAYLLTTYVPGYAEHWPMFSLYGSVNS